jgi:hypothetical protein
MVFFVVVLSHFFFKKISIEDFLHLPHSVDALPPLSAVQTLGVHLVPKNVTICITRCCYVNFSSFVHLQRLFCLLQRMLQLAPARNIDRSRGLIFKYWDTVNKYIFIENSSLS